jgi:hypothetical protein
MEKSLIEISRYFGENREAVVYRNMVEERSRGVKTYEVHRYEGKTKLIPIIDFNVSVDMMEDIAENFVTYNDEEKT